MSFCLLWSACHLCLWCGQASQLSVEECLMLGQEMHGKEVEGRHLGVKLDSYA